MNDILVTQKQNMEHEENNNSGPRQSALIGRSSSSSSSLKRHSSSFSYVFPCQEDGDSESEPVSESADIENEVLHGSSNGGRVRFQQSFDSVGERSAAVPTLEDSSLQCDRDNVPSSDAIVQSADKKNVEEKMASWILDYISCITFLALFGILGVITRYYLQKLFGPGVIGATSDKLYMYLDLPSNMVGSFLMGWWGIVYKKDISRVSDNLATGLTTGFLGSLTTFSGWNQKMLDLSVEGEWIFAILGFLIGLSLASCSIVFGIETAKGFKWLKRKYNMKLKFPSCICIWSLDMFNINLAVTILLLLILAAVWGVCIALAKTEFQTARDNAMLLLACIVGPFGVWIRWLLARFNGRGIGKIGLLKWIPFGTLAANVLAASIMAVLATLKKAVDTEACNTAATGIQVGFLGCLSTVSTFIAEFHAMRQSKYPWRAYAYAMSTMLISFALGTLIYSVPVWAKGYH